ncbi:hypothetical protein EN844_01945 [Mesorhizobium sp. M3A.F.Ca.ET.201.01.1.1]|uniref:hypothetical protein n=1 Tax=Mesorhizobium sp. M3A.F.Ca.ET.201.01.1.1 TaxID=2563946 RepID=UPI0010938D14|nr:hypothetical protein [Mesorhizobium sp. M3A.F.Ca.ET.201.01.1.1]TGS71769.1 hypothetical protein EN844_01945 [Mesorhizobium sp. M3A.F.Ca.ET.201.01.1.1]
MAEELKREHQLMSLRMELLAWSGDPYVWIEFESGGSSKKNWKVPASMLGLTREERSSLPQGPHLPHGLAHEIAATANENARTGPSEPLWLHLIRPYGLLGAMPWERLLGDVVNRPILRLPDFLERSKEDPDTLEIAVCFDPSIKGDHFADFRRVHDVICSAFDAPRAQVVAHLFTTPKIAEHFGAYPIPRLNIHSPAPALSASESGFAGPRSFSPWLGWIESVLRDEALDAVHFICPTESSDERSNLLLRASPGVDEAKSLTAVYPSEVASFLQRIGAWAVLFSPPQGSGTEESCRYFADNLAQIRPGPVLYHEFDDDIEQVRNRLDKVYQFLFASDPSEAPQLRRDFLYCQPALVSNYQNWDAERTEVLGPPRASIAQRILARVTQQTDLIPDYHLPEAPMWTSAAQRFVEKASLDSSRFLRTAQGKFLTETVSSSALSANNAVQSTLSDIQKIIDQHTMPPKD